MGINIYIYILQTIDIFFNTFQPSPNNPNNPHPKARWGKQTQLFRAMPTLVTFEGLDPDAEALDLQNQELGKKGAQRHRLRSR